MDEAGERTKINTVR